MSAGKTVAPAYSRKLDDALVFAADAFRERYRKGTKTPYLTHLLQVMVTVGENGGDEEQMIAALLHDYLEDIPGASRDLVATQFGERVAKLVEGLSDSVVIPKPPWEERKRAYLAKLVSAPAELKLISASDKLHNAQSIVRDLDEFGEFLWARFSASRDQSLWYYREVHRALATGWTHRLVTELERVVRRMHEKADVPQT